MKACAHISVIGGTLPSERSRSLRSSSVMGSVNLVMLSFHSLVWYSQLDGSGFILVKGVLCVISAALRIMSSPGCCTMYIHLVLNSPAWMLVFLNGDTPTAISVLICSSANLL